MGKKYIDLKEFQEAGYLQELNRQFLHPLGLSMVVNICDETSKTKSFVSILDAREDPEGYIFGFKNWTPEELDLFRKKYKFIHEDTQQRIVKRFSLIGMGIENIPQE